MKAEGSKRNRWRRAALVAALVAAPFAAVALAVSQLGRFDLAGLASARVSAAIGRPVTIGTLHVHPGRWLRLEAADIRVANLPGAAVPDMLRAARLEAELDPVSLIRGPLVLRRITVEQAKLRLEPVGGIWNWRFGRGKAAGAHAPEIGNQGFPSLRDLRVRDFDIVYAMKGGLTLRTHLDQAHLASDADAAPVQLGADGSYNGHQAALVAGLGSLDTFRQGVRLPAWLNLTAGANTLRFEGSFTDPLDVDGAEGRLTLDAPHAAGLFAIAGLNTAFDPALQLAGHFQRRTDHWELTGAAGTFDRAKVTAEQLAFDEGSARTPDAIAARVKLDQLDLNAWPAGKGSGAGSAPLLVADANPDPLLDIRLGAGAIDYGSFHASNFRVAATRTAGRIGLGELGLSWLGARVQASGGIGAGSGLALDGSVSDADIETFRKQFGVALLPVSGRLAGLVSARAPAGTLDRAIRGANVSAVFSLSRGSMAKRAVELASTDLRLLFRKNQGFTPVSCLLAVVAMQGGSGTVSPLRIATGAGTIAGRGRFDLNRRTLDMVVTSERATTHFLALDVAMRVSGGFASPRVLPARLSAAGRADLAKLDALPKLPPALLARARANACFRSR